MILNRFHCLHWKYKTYLCIFLSFFRLILKWNVTWKIYFHEISPFSFTQTELERLLHFNSLLLRLPALQNISSWDKLSFEQKGGSCMRTVQKECLNQKERSQYQFNKTERVIKITWCSFSAVFTANQKVVATRSNGKDRCNGSYLSTKKFLQTIHAEERQIWPSENPLYPCAANQTDATRSR